jgi:hypothetical protein
MAEEQQPHAEGASPKHETLMEKLADRLHVGGGGSSSSSDSDNDDRPRPSAPTAPAPAPAPAEVKPSFSDSAAKTKVFRLFGREQPVHKVLGGGKRMCLC